MVAIHIKKGDWLQHRAWKRFCVSLEDFQADNHLSYISVLYENGKVERLQLLSLIFDYDDFLYDWNDDNETIKRRSTG